MSRIDFFDSGSNKLSFVCTVPDEQSIKASLIFVHAADGNRLGPHRMFVELAESLKEHGIASFRFDMRGCGDSLGQPARTDITPDIEDLLNAIKFFASKYNPPKIFLFGISRGAHASISALAEHRIPVSGAILLSTPFAGTKAAAKKFSDRLKEYLYKFTNPASLKKLFTGKANFKQIVKTFGIALSSQKRYRRNSNGFATTRPMFFIYGSKDPIAADSGVYYSRMCQRYKISYKMTDIKNANHSFFHYKWKEQIIDLTEKWLLENISNGEENVRRS